MASIKQIKVDSTTYDIDAVTLGGQAASYYASAGALSDYIPLSGTTSIYGDLVPSTNYGVDLGASNKNFRSIYGARIVTDTIHNGSNLWLIAGSYDTANPGDGIGLEAQNHWNTLYTSVASGYYDIGIYSGNTLFSISAGKSFGSEFITIGHNGTSAGLGIKLQTHNSTSICIYTTGMSFTAQNYIEMRGSEYGGYMNLDYSGVHMWANYSNYNAAQLQLGTYSTILTGFFYSNLMPHLIMTSSFIGLGWHPSQPSSYMYLSMASNDAIMYNPSGSFGIGFHYSALGYGFITNDKYNGTPGFYSVYRAAKMGPYIDMPGGLCMSAAPITAGWIHNVYMYQASKCALKFSFYNLNSSPINSATQTTAMTSTSANCSNTLTRLAKYLYWNGYSNASNALMVTGWYSGTGSKIALGIYAAGYGSTYLNIVYVSGMAYPPSTAGFNFTSSTTANIYIYDTIGGPCGTRAPEGIVNTIL